jgi:Ca2+-binding RTX toxin-like protein
MAIISRTGLYAVTDVGSVDTYTAPTSILVSTVTPVEKLPQYGLYVEGTWSNDTLYGTSNADEIHGLDGNDSLYGGGGNDRLFGDAGNDYLVGGEGNDTVDGGTGNDYIMAGNGNDTLIGGAGSDTLDFSATSVSGGITVDLNNGFNTTGDTISGIENLVGTAFGDILNGDANNNNLKGGAGDDWLFGQAGNDIIDGGIGNDQIQGGSGVDYLYGGAGNDRLTGGQDTDFFVFTPANGFDTVTDFLSGTDKIGLSGFGAKPFGNDGIIAYGEFGYEIGPGHSRLTHFSNLDSSDKLLYDYHTQTLYKVDPVYINGNIADYNAQAIAHIDYDPSSYYQVGNNDFIFL